MKILTEGIGCLKFIMTNFKVVIKMVKIIMNKPPLPNINIRRGLTININEIKVYVNNAYSKGYLFYQTIDAMVE